MNKKDLHILGDIESLLEYMGDVMNRPTGDVVIISRNVAKAVVRSLKHAAKIINPDSGAAP